MIRLAIILSILILDITAAHASDLSYSHASDYSGEEKQAIKSLSADDIAELKRGGGWGLAKAAELKRYTGTYSPFRNER